MNPRLLALDELELLIQQGCVLGPNIRIDLVPDIPRLLCKIYKSLRNTAYAQEVTWVEPRVTVRVVSSTEEKEISNLGLTFRHPDTDRLFLHISVDPRLEPERYFFDCIGVVVDRGDGFEMFDLKYNTEETSFAELVEAYREGLKGAPSTVCYEEEPAIPPTPMILSIFDYLQEIKDFYEAGYDDIAPMTNERKRQIFKKIADFLRDTTKEMVRC